MPSGKNHDRITLLCLPWLTVIATIITRKVHLTFLVIAGFLFSGFMFGPDLDIYSIQYKRWGILRWLWLPYQKLISHRSVLSHGLIIGTIIRSVYLLSFILSFAFLFVAILQLIFGFHWNWQEFIIFSFDLTINNYQKEALALFCGLELGAMSHYLADLVTSWWILLRRDAETQRYSRGEIKSKQGKKTKARKYVRKNTKKDL